MNRKVVALLNNLRDLELVESIPCEVKNHQPTEEYRYTSLGRLVGLLLSYKKNKSEVSEEIYNHILDFYDNMDHTFAKLCSIFFRKSHNSPIYKEMIDLLVDLLDNADDNKELFIKQIRKLTPILSKESWEIIDGSFVEFDKKYESKYGVLFYNFKLYLEGLHEIKSRNLKSYEKSRFLAIQEPFIVVLEGYCTNCKHYTPFSIGLIQYLRSYASTNPSDRANHMRAECPNCKNGFVDFEFIENIKVIKDTSNKKIKKKELVTLRVFENEIDIVGTIFEMYSKR